MKLFAPKYYNNFKCIADKCSHSCCVGWEIDVDEYALDKYASLSCNYGESIRKSIDYSDTPHFKLDVHERCPHLDGQGLCKIISELGEEYLCSICREHPRFYNDTCLGKEVGLGMACEEACSIILSSDDYQSIVGIGKLDGEAEIFEFNAILCRLQIYSILSNRSVPYEERLKSIYAEMGVSPSKLCDDEWKEVISQLEYMENSHRELFFSYSSELTTPQKNNETLERALAYFVYRHCSEAYDESDFRQRLGLCLFCERLFASVLRGNYGDPITLARIISEEIEYSEDNSQTIKLCFS